MAKSLAEVLEEHGLDEDAIESLDLDGLESDLRENYGPKAIRKQLEEALPKARRTEDLEKEVASLKKGPVKEKAFRDYGVDLDSLKPAEKEAFERFDWKEGDAPTEDEIAAFVEKYDLEVDDQQEEEDEPVSGQIAKQARRSDGANSRTKISAEQASEWPAETWTRFEREFPDQARQVLEGESVTAAFAP